MNEVYVMIENWLHTDEQEAFGVIENLAPRKVSAYVS